MIKYGSNEESKMSAIIKDFSLIYQESTTFEKMSYIPLASNVSGIANIARGIFSQLTGILMILTDKDFFNLKDPSSVKSNRFNGVELLGAGLALVGRGIIEQIPIIGNLALATFDIWYKFDYRDESRDHFD